jgi:hypothetical protein
VTYGGYVSLPQPARYKLTFIARRPAGSARAVFLAERP